MVAVALVVPQTAVAAPGDAALTVRVVKEVNANGAWDSVLEPGIASTTIRVTDNAGTVVTTTTNAAGSATIDTTTLVGGKYRVEVINPKPDLYFPAFASTAGDTPSATRLSSAEEFVDLTLGAPVTMTTAFWEPSDYCQSNPSVAMACQPGMNALGSAFLSNANTLFTMPYQFSSSTSPSFFSNNNVTGAVYGIGVKQTLTPTGGTQHRIFAGAYAKRGSQYSANGPGAIYVQNRGNANAPVTLFGVVPNAGTTAHNVANQDIAFVPVVGKEGLGDIDVSSDGKHLFVVNLANKRLYVYDAADTSGAAVAQTILDIPNPGCGAEWRPMGLGEREGLLYVGGVCDQVLTSHVTTLNISTMSWTNSWPMSNQSLAYERGTNQAENTSCRSANWNRWIDALPALCADVLFSPQRTWPQPMLADIEFRNDGALIASFRDRTADQYGAALYARTSAGGYSIPYIVSSGDLLLACNTANGYRLDVLGGCGTPAGEFFDQDSRFGTVHQESYYGGIVYLPTELGMISNAIDPENTAYSSGITRFTVNGPSTTQANRQLVPLSGPDALGGFGKGQGLADMEALCNLAPLQIGNRVWYDRDQDGTQDAAETALAGVTVELVRNGAVIGSRVTNARGEYYFASTDANLNGQFVPNGGDYTIRFVKPTTGTVNLGAPEGTQPWSRLSLTAQAQGTNTHIDSNPDRVTGEYVYTAGGPGQNNHTIDAGYILNTPRLEFAKTSNPAPGTVVRSGDTITYSVTATNTGTAPATEGTLTDDMSQVLDKATLDPAGAVPVLTCTPTTATCGSINFQAATQRIVWTASAVAPLPVGATATITYTVRINEGATGTIRNVLVEPGVSVEHPIVTSSKVGTPGDGVRVSPGDTVGYTIGVRNTGAVASQSFSVTDDLSAVVDKATFDPASISIVPAIGTATYDPATMLLTWTGALPAGQEVLVSYNVTVNADAFGELRNSFLGTEVVNPVAAALTWNKVDPDGGRLSGSEWTLTRTVTPAEPAIVVVDCIAAVATDCTEADVDPTAGGIRVEDLTPGQYQLVETKAPFGFTMLMDPILVTVLDDRAVTTLPDIQNVQQDVPSLPLTGGLGADQVLLGGALLFALSGALGFWQVRRRRHA